MARKKAAAEDFICLHCQGSFKIPVKWCPRCEDHGGLDGFLDGKDTCDRCHSGANDRYLKRKKGSAERIAKELARIHAEYGPLREPFTSPLVKAYEEWCNSEAYKHRFDRTEQQSSPAALTTVVRKPAASFEDEEEQERKYEDPTGFIPGY